MDNDENVKNNRLAMLTELKEKYEKVADFSKFQQGLKKLNLLL